MEELKNKLQSVNCALLSNQEDSWLQKLLFLPSEEHFEFLQWILSSFDNTLADSFQKRDYSSMTINKKEKYLLQLCSSFGICGKDDVDVIKGIAAESEVVNFWKQLVDFHLACVNSKEEETFDISGVRSNNDASYLSQMVQAHRRPKKWTLFPVAYEHKVKALCLANPNPPSKDEIQGMLAQFNQVNLEQEQKECTQDTTGDSLHNDLMQSLSQLKETVSGFQECHKQLQPWVNENQQKQDSGPLGPLIKEVADKMLLFQETLEGIEGLGEFCDRIKNNEDIALPKLDILPDAENSMATKKTIETLNIALQKTK